MAEQLTPLWVQLTNLRGAQPLHHQKFGRRKPFFLIGAIIASITLVVMPYSSSIWMAAGLLWILDAANNIALEPYRAFISDKLPEKQYSFGFLVQSFFTGLGTTLANFTPAILVSFGILALSDKMDNGIPVSTYWAFGIGAVASIISLIVREITFPSSFAFFISSSS